MTCTSPCPPADELRRLLLGQLSEAEAEGTEGHLLECDACLQTLASLQAQDTLCGALAGGSTVEELTDSQVDVEGLIRQFKGLCPPSRLTNPTAEVARPASSVPEQIGRYRILGRIGAGGMGEVYKAQDPKLDRVVALKVPRFDGVGQDEATARLRFLREARAAAQVRHPHICPVYDVGEHEGLPYVVMAFVEGQSLADRLAGGARFDDSAEAVALTCQVAEALEAVHGHGIIHRDLKPGNVLLDRAGRAMLTDFGLARPTADAEQLTATGSLLGTPAYMAPEQASAKAGEVGPWTDLYSLGVVLYRMLTGRVPFEGEVIAVIHDIVHEEAPPPSRFRPDLDPSLERIIRKAMARRRENRYASTRELAGALQYWLTQRGTGTGEKMGAIPTATQSAARSRHRSALRPSQLPGSLRRWNPFAAIVLLAVLLPVTYFFGGTVIRVVMNKGELVIETDDPNIEVTVKDGSATIHDKVKDRRFVLSAGEHDVEVREFGDGGVRFATKKFTITRGGKETLVARLALEKAASITNSIGMEFARIPEGSFAMGSPEGENGARDEKQHEVEITRSFYMGVYEVAQEEYVKVMGINPSGFSAEGDRKEDVLGLSTGRFPVEQVSWHDAVEFCKKLSERPEEKRAGRVYRLPTEAEWEYACRGGADTAFHFGNDLSADLANFHGDYPYGNAPKGKYLNRPTVVRSYQPNTFGLYNMHGNVREWCADYYHKDFYEVSPRKDPRNDTKGAEDRRVLRGGSWAHEGGACRAARREGWDPNQRDKQNGFRVVLVPGVGNRNP